MTALPTTTGLSTHGATPSPLIRISYFLLCSLEVLDEEGGLKREADLFTKRTIRSYRPAEKSRYGGGGAGPVHRGRKPA